MSQDDYPKQDNYGNFQDNRGTDFQTNTGNKPEPFETVKTDKGPGWWNGREVVRD